MGDLSVCACSFKCINQFYLLPQIFFLQGRLIFGPDVRSLGLTIFLIVAPISVFCVFVARKLMDDYPHHLGISIMVVAVTFTVYVSFSFHSFLLDWDASILLVRILIFCVVSTRVSYFKVLYSFCCSTLLERF